MRYLLVNKEDKSVIKLKEKKIALFWTYKGP